jgi:hypothetical protein
MIVYPRPFSTAFLIASWAAIASQTTVLGQFLSNSVLGLLLAHWNRQRRKFLLFLWFLTSVMIGELHLPLELSLTQPKKQKRAQ